MTVYRIDLGYDGTGFRGWARNQGVRTVQEDIETALGRVLGASVALSVAGRTDAGVHARHQVASFPFEGAIDPEALVRSLRTMLGPEIAIHSIRSAPEGFDARFSAVRRSYRYFVDEAPSHDPLQARWVWHRGEPLDLEAMNRAAAGFVGAHDFAALCRASERGSSERTVESAGWDRSVIRHPSSVPASEPRPHSRAPGADGRRKTDDETSVDEGLLVFSVSARAFCHQMVRSMVALCVEVGRRRLPAEAVPGILEAKDRNAARGVAPPHGLVLWEVEY